MATFPLLKTGAVMQAPASRTLQFATEIVQFVDGSEQRFRNHGTPLRRWVITLSSLDEGELNGLRRFIEETDGAAGTFAFTDPWDGTVYSNCSIEDRTLIDIVSGPMTGSSKVVIRENRT